MGKTSFFVTFYFFFLLFFAVLCLLTFSLWILLKTHVIRTTQYSLFEGCGKFYVIFFNFFFVWFIVVDRMDTLLRIILFHFVCLFTSELMHQYKGKYIAERYIHLVDRYDNTSMTFYAFRVSCVATIQQKLLCSFSNKGERKIVYQIKNFKIVHYCWKTWTW